MTSAGRLTVRRRAASVLLVPVVALVAALQVSTPARAAHDAPPLRTITYEVQQRGAVATDLEQFARHAASTLAEPAGWSLGGSVAYQRVASGGEFTLWLAEASTLPSFGYPCHPDWSCRSGRNVIINETRWRTASAAWTRSLDEYQHYVVVHELGHWLGQGHASCGGRGQPAPVMQQQSISLKGCVANVWPLGWEREAVARRLGVPVRHDVFSDLAGSLHAEAVRVLAHAGVVTGFPDGSYRPLETVRRGQLATFLTRARGLQPTGATDFPDIADSVHAEGIRAIADANIATGYADGTFGPRDPVLRGQMAALLARTLALDTSDASCAPPDSVDSVHAGAVCAVMTAGVAHGVTPDRFEPGSIVSRGQMASFLARMQGLLPDG